MYGQNPYNQYKQTQVQTATPEKLVLMLYDGGLKFLRQAKTHIENDDKMEANEKLKRSQMIINELMSSLDTKKGGEVANNLLRLYEYMMNELVQANIKKDSARVDQVISMMENLKQTFQEANKKVGQSQKEAGGLSGHA